MLGSKKDLFTLIIALVAVVVSIGSVYYTRVQARQAGRATQIKEERRRDELNDRQARIEAARHAHIRLKVADRYGGKQILIASNDGPHVARNVCIEHNGSGANLVFQPITARFMKTNEEISRDLVVTFATSWPLPIDIRWTDDAGTHENRWDLDR